MRAPGAVFVVLALVIGLVPLVSDCDSQGNRINLASGITIPMRCHWTGRAELAVAAPLLVVGVWTLASRRRHVLRALAVLGLVLGLLAILLPTTLIGVCTNPEMICNLLMRPTLVFAGVLTCATGLAGLLYLRGEGLDLVDSEG